jgi:hypothetical protein
MASATSDRLGFEIQAIGENENTWGDTRLNNALICLEEGIAGFVSVAVGSSDVTLTSTIYTPEAAEYRNAIIKLTSGSGVGARNIIVPALQKLWKVHNATAYTQTFKTAAGTGSSVASGEIVSVYCDGTDCYTDTASGGGAAASAAAAAASAVAADASADEAAASAAAAALVIAPANSAPGRGVTPLVFADSPRTIVNADNGYFLACDCTSGNIVLNLTALSSLSLPFNVMIKKTDSSANTVTINRGSTNTFDNAATSKTLSYQGQGAWLVGGTATWYTLDSNTGSEATTTQFWTGTSAVVQVTPNVLFDSVAYIASSGTGTFTPDMNTGLNFRRTMTGNTTVAAPTNPKDGQTLVIRFIHSGGARTITFNSVFKFANGVIPSASTSGSGAVDTLVAVYDSTSTAWDATFQTGMA